VHDTIEPDFREVTVTEPITHTLDVPGAALTYDVHEPEITSDHRPLLIVGSPMGASGFGQLVPHFSDRTVVTYDPRGMERSQLLDGGAVTVEIHGDDIHRVVAASGLGPVDVFGSSGGAMVVLPWLVAHPGEVGTVVAHEPPLVALLDDYETVTRVNADIVDTYQRDGYGRAMAKFIQLVMHVGPLSDDYLDQPAPDADVLRATGVRIVPAIGSDGEGTMARRGGEAFAALLDVEPVIFPGDHGGFTVSEWSPGNDPAAFAAKLREVLDGEPTRS
jgi:pimeloyl-ACP methyl ester carboxylesterase